MSQISEYEFKFESSTNLQFKYNIIERPSDFRRKFECIIKLLDMRIIDTVSRRLEDEYFDDDQGEIHKAGYSLRIRRGEDGSAQHEATLKSHDSSNDKSALHRKEWTSPLTDTQRLALISDKKAISKIFPNRSISLTSDLKSLVHVINDRLIISFESETSVWRACYDLFYFFFPRTGLFSPKLSEIEIENTDDDTIVSPKITKLQTAIANIFDLRAHKQTKFQRAIKFQESDTPAVTFVSTVGFDIVGYSSMSSMRQLECIQKLNKFVKDSIQKATSDTSQHVCIPTGDGMFVVFESHHSRIVSIVELTQDMTRQWNKDHPGSEFVFRTAIHAGTVFRYTDINENLNYAGNGINIAARVLGFGDGWHILASSEARELLVAQHVDTSFFHDAGTRTVKHGLQIRIFNIFSQRRFGNPVAP